MSPFCDNVFDERYSMRNGEVEPVIFRRLSQTGRRRENFTMPGDNTGAHSNRTDDRDVNGEEGGDLDYVSFGGDGEDYFSIQQIEGMLMNPSAMDEFLSTQDQADGRALSNPKVEMGIS